MNPEKQTETLEVKNFAGLRDVKITLSDINLFIGPQASGKSIIAKLLYFFKSAFRSVIFLLPSQKTKSKQKINEDILKRFEDFFPARSLASGTPFEVRYESGKEFAEVVLGRSTSARPEIRYSRVFTSLAGPNPLTSKTIWELSG